MQLIASLDRGVLVYLRGHEGRGIGLANKISAYELQDQGLDTVDANLHLGLPADSRDYSPAASILTHLGVASVRLITNNPEKEQGLLDLGLTIVERVALPMAVTPHNERYLRTKRERMGHRFQL
jgi:3,4-dihydroxy 2-butanone 4-phosphate synthase/GTP cyclohydrolase II